MKKIALYFYSAQNLGDDLFVKVFAEHFADCRINLISNPRYIPKNLKDNVRVHPHSVINLLLRKLQYLLGDDHKAAAALRRVNDSCFQIIRERNDAYVMIGGSLFPDYPPDEHSLDFSAHQEPDFSFRSKPQEQGNSFVIGANLGPVYRESYWQMIRERLKAYAHVCVRDYASYMQVKDLPHVQYAPDVLFMVPKPKVERQKDSVVISVIDISKHTMDDAVIDAYDRLIADAAVYFTDKNFRVTMVSFCKWEEDETAIDRIMLKIPNTERISKLCYTGNAQQILETIAQSAFVVASRFHSMILAVSFGIPVFPIAYNCKTEHYLQDLKFAGRYASLETLPTTCLEDLLYNYHNQIITDCEEHKKFAQNQFQALRQFLQ